MSPAPWLWLACHIVMIVSSLQHLAARLLNLSLYLNNITWLPLSFKRLLWLFKVQRRTIARRQPVSDKRSILSFRMLESSCCFCQWNAGCNWIIDAASHLTLPSALSQLSHVIPLYSCHCRRGCGSFLSSLPDANVHLVDEYWKY